VPRKRADTLLERAFAALASALDGASVPYMIVGGVAVIAHGVKRLTTDVDAVVQGGSIDPKSLIRVLARAGIEPRIDRAEAFARENLVLLLRHANTGVDLDVSLGFTRFELEALAARRQVRFGTVQAPMARPEDLVIFKALAARPKDIGDATALLVMHADIDISRVRERVAELAALAEAPELASGLEAVIVRAAQARRGIKPRAEKKRRSTRTAKGAKPKSKGK
jgi:hypothetical protein